MNCLKKFLFCTNPCNWGTVPIRLALGLVFIFHGSQKLLGWFGGPGLEGFAAHMDLQPPKFWAVLAANGEFFGGLLVLLGLFTRFGALNIAVTMAVAVLHVHWAKGFAAKDGGFEYPLTLLLAAIALMISGGGAASFDSCISGKCKGTTMEPKAPK
jgi:putative oxidoreductase